MSPGSSAENPNLFLTPPPPTRTKQLNHFAGREAECDREDRARRLSGLRCIYSLKIANGLCRQCGAAGQIPCDPGARRPSAPAVRRAPVQTRVGYPRDQRDPMNRRARDVLIDILRDEGITHVFGNPGSTEMPLMDALVDAPDIRYVLGLQEATAVGMADGWALATGRTAFVNLHAMGGLGNAMGVLVAAKASETPLVVTAGQQDTRHLMNEPWLSGDLVGLA